MPTNNKKYDRITTSMKKTRLLITLLVIMVAGSSYAQDSYRDAVRSYLALSKKSTAEKMLTALKQLNPVLFEYNESVDFDQMAARYINEQFSEDMTDMMVEVVSETITEGDLRKVIAFMSTTEGESLRVHTSEWGEVFGKDAQEAIQQPLISAMAGIPVAPVLADSDIPEEYAEKFMRFFDNSHGAEQFMSSFNQGLAMSGGDVPDGFQDWLSDNVSTIAMNSAYGILTTADLDYSAKLFNYEYYRRVFDAMSFFNDNLMLVGAVCTLNYADWMSERGIELSSTGQQIVDYYLQILNEED